MGGAQYTKVLFRFLLQCLGVYFHFPGSDDILYKDIIWYTGFAIQNPVKPTKLSYNNLKRVLLNGSQNVYKIVCKIFSIGELKLKFFQMAKSIFDRLTHKKLLNRNFYSKPMHEQIF